MLKAFGSRKILTQTPYFKLMEELICTKEIQSLKEYTHHKKTTRFQHCLNVSYYNYVICRRFGLDAYAAARAGLLHDLFFYDSTAYKKHRGHKHLRKHPLVAAENAQQFGLSPLELDIVKKHMFPITSALPKYRETVVIIFVDKYCALLEYFRPVVRKMFKCA
ncbi:MAG: HDIG domain-containing protein [Oscillospiraceae bacterium]|jgi:uncharacterized protein|nr:HDIG domain-containing protein [Oscillospiraceae bacterium]